MAMWHCPHCGAPQAETARCWVCRRSSTTCSTCRHFRASLATDVGYCALDRRRRPLTGTELRGCWSERASVGPADGATPGADAALDGALANSGPDHRLRLPRRDFVPVEAVAPRPESVPAPTFLSVDPTDAWEPPTSLFGDAER